MVYVAFTVNLTHQGTLVSRWNDRRGPWVPLPGYKLEHHSKSVDGEGFALIWSESDEDPKGVVHKRYKFRGGAEVTQERLHALLDDARAVGKTEIVLS